jgi:hypothetical protein
MLDITLVLATTQRTCSIFQHPKELAQCMSSAHVVGDSFDKKYGCVFRKNCRQVILLWIRWL